MFTRMMRPLRVSIGITLALLTVTACDEGVRAEPEASRATDSSLARDLEIAQKGRDVMRSSDGRDSGAITASSGMLDSSADSVRAPSLEETSARNASNASAATPSAEGYIGPSCASPALDDQRRCLLGYLAKSDARLDRNYQALIGQLKAEARTRKGAPEPPAVERLRTAQRSWLVYRDEECRNRTRAEEGPLWAPVRAKCLAEYSALRARELEDALAKRKAVVARQDSAKSESTRGRRSTRQRGSRGR
jgi:uncharacterized protein YecT (DUF1311 family)